MANEDRLDSLKKEIEEKLKKDEESDTESANYGY